MDKMREEFKAWASKCNDAKKVKIYLASSKNGDYYIYPETDLLWQAWQASRKALVVELPDLLAYGIDAAVYRDDVFVALDAAGVAYK